MRGFIPWIGGGETWACHKESVRGVRTCGRKPAVAVPRAHCVEPSELSRGNAVDAAALPTGAP